MTSSLCVRCGTELAPEALACPACASLVHGETLKQLASEADGATAAGDLVSARTHWATALTLLPAHSQQFASIQERHADLGRRIELAADPAAPFINSEKKPWWRRGVPAILTLAVVLLSKLKFLLLGLTKASTFLSMFAFFGVYWSIYGWPLALGLVVSIYIHEMGHVAMLRRVGIDAGAPMFIPGVGAYVLLKQQIVDPLTDAKVGLAGPQWGLAAALGAFGVYVFTGAPIWFAIAQLTGFINLFNLIPVWQLDGSRGFHVLARWERWALVAAIALALVVTQERILWIVGGVAVWRAFQHETGPGNSRMLATFVVLIFALSLLARGVHATPAPSREHSSQAQVGGNI